MILKISWKLLGNLKIWKQIRFRNKFPILIIANNFEKIWKFGSGVKHILAVFKLFISKNTQLTIYIELCIEIMHDQSLCISLYSIKIWDQSIQNYPMIRELFFIHHLILMASWKTVILHFFETRSFKNKRTNHAQIYCMTIIQIKLRFYENSEYIHWKVSRWQ